MFVNQLTQIIIQSLPEDISCLNYDIATMLRSVIENKKYDIQDLALIEAIINDPEKQLHHSLTEDYEAINDKIIKEHTSLNNIEEDILKQEILEVFISNLEYYIDFFYNNLINKHFSSG